MSKSNSSETTAEAALKTVTDVSQLAGSDPSKAYSKLQSEIVAEQKKDGGSSSQTYNEYIQSVTKDLTQAGLLPMMSLAWAGSSEVESTLESLSNHNGTITTQGVSDYINDIGQGGYEPVNPAVTMFANSLTKQIGSGSLQSSDLSASNPNSKISIDQDLYKNANFTRAFVGDKNDPKAVFELLDTAANGGKADGKFDRADVQAFLNNPADQDLLDHALGFTPEQVQTIHNELSDMAHHWNSPGVAALENGNGEITYSSIAKAYGETNFGSLAKAVNDGTFDTVPEAAPSDPSKGTKHEFAAQPDSRSEEVAELTKDANNDALDQLIADSRVKDGDGYWSVAGQLLGTKASDPEIEHLAGILEELNANQPVIQPKEELLSASNIGKVLKEDPALNAIYSAEEQKLERTFDTTVVHTLPT